MASTSSAPIEPAAPAPTATSRRRRGGPRPQSLAVLGALLIVVAVVLYLVLSNSGGADYKLVFANSGQIVLGDEVQVGGVVVGSVKDVALTKKFKAVITIHVNSSLTPLHRGSSVQIRSPSLSGVANRYIALSPGPNNRPAIPAGSALPASAAHGIVDVDELFNIFTPRTRRALQEVFQGSAQQYRGTAKDLSTSTEYFGPAIAATGHLFGELSRDQNTLEKFLVDTSKAVTTIAARAPQLTSLVGNADQTFAAIGSRQSDLAEGLRELPGTLRQGNRTFSELPSALAALTKLVNVSKPDTKTLAPFLERLRPLIKQATQVLPSFSEAFSKPGPDNDLTEAVKALPVLAKALSTSSPDTVKALQESAPITGFFGPYSPDLEGFLRDFGQGSSYYDANGHYARVAPTFDSFKLSEGNLTPVNPQEGLQGLKTRQLRRCPGAAAEPTADGSAPFTDEGKLDCDPTETP